MKKNIILIYLMIFNVLLSLPVKAEECDICIKIAKLSNVELYAKIYPLYETFVMKEFEVTTEKEAKQTNVTIEKLIEKSVPLLEELDKRIFSKNELKEIKDIFSKKTQVLSKKIEALEKDENSNNRNIFFSYIEENSYKAAKLYYPFQILGAPVKNP